jgi:putative transposase
MAGIARAVAAGLPHHLTQRRNRRREIFFCDDDYRACIRLMGQGARKQETREDRETFRVLPAL